MFQTVQVVSIEDVTIKLGTFSFHEKLVSGAPECWFCCTFEPDSAALKTSRCPPEGCLPTKFDVCNGASSVYSQTLNESPVVANSSVPKGFCVHWNELPLLGIHCRLVAGYPWLASTSVAKSG